MSIWQASTNRSRHFCDPKGDAALTPPSLSLIGMSYFCAVELDERPATLIFIALAN